MLESACYPPVTGEIVRSLTSPGEPLVAAKGTQTFGWECAAWFEQP